MIINIIIEYSSVAYLFHRLSKKIPSDVAEWTEYMQSKTGAVFFVLGAYTDEDGKLSFARLYILISFICATRLMLSAGMRPKASVSWRHGKNTGKVQTT